MAVTILTGDALTVLRGMEPESVDCVVTSPPYWGLRDYGTALWEGGDPSCDHSVARRGHGAEKQSTSAGTSRDSLAGASACRQCGAARIDRQLGLEPTYHEHVDAMVSVFREVRRVLKPAGTLWLNYGDSYATTVNGRSAADTKAVGNDDRTFRDKPFSTIQGVLKPKDLCGMPWRVAFALQADGWFLRQDIIWSKPNPMPESVQDRCTKAHEYLFLLSKSARYHFDARAIAEPANCPEGAGNAAGNRYIEAAKTDPKMRTKAGLADIGPRDTRNKRSVWTIATQPFSEAHFATMPVELAETCIKAGCPRGGLVLDPFGGAGTTGLAADRLGRNATLIELNPTYVEIARNRLRADAGMFAEVA